MAGARKPRLLLTTLSPYRGGAEEYLLRMAQAAQARYDVAAALSPVPALASLRDDFKGMGVTVHPFDAIAADEAWANRGVRRALAVSVAKAIGLLRRARPDVVLLQLGWPDRAFGVMIACRLLRIPCAVVFQLVRNGYKARERTISLYAWCRKAQPWIAVSDDNRRILADAYRCPAASLHRVYNGARPVARFEQPEAVRAAARAELGIGADEALLLSVGRLGRQKGHFELAAAIAAAAPDFPKARFVWVGNGPERAQVEQHLRETGAAPHVRLLGHRGDVPRLLLAADVFVLPSLFEGFPFAPLEAASFGLPIVTSDASSIPEIFTHETHALLARAGDAASLEQALRRALAHPAEMKAMGAAARERAAQFNEERMTTETLALIDALAAKGR